MMKIYIDTSVIGGCFDLEFSEWSNKLINEIRKGKIIAAVSDLTLQELDKAPNKVKHILQTIPPGLIEMIELDDEVKLLARRYIQEGAVSSKHIVDAQSR